MGRFWSLLFLSVPIVGTGIFVWSAFGWYPLAGHWLPENVNAYGGVIDNLFLFILYLTGVIFIGTSLALFWFVWKYDAAKNAEPAKFTHGSHTLEVVWSILPAAALLFIAIYQMNAWADHKMRRPINPGADGIVGTADDPMTAGEDGKMHTADDVPALRPPLAEVTGRQFEWRIRYAGKDNILGTKDDLFDVNELYVPVQEDVVLRIQSEDVLHSFFLPHLRIKQDVVPGMEQYVWFRATREEPRGFDIVCAELCGWGHYKMKGRIKLVSRAEFDSQIARLYALQETNSIASVKGESE